MTNTVLPENTTPDIIDLQSWLASATDKNLVQIWEATKYLSSPYTLWLKVWRENGTPDITMPSM